MWEILSTSWFLNKHCVGWLPPCGCVLQNMDHLVGWEGWPFFPFSHLGLGFMSTHICATRLGLGACFKWCPWRLYDLYLEPQTTINKWMFGETTIFYIKIWNHPIETSIYKWLFGVPGTKVICKSTADLLFFFLILEVKVPWISHHSIWKRMAVWKSPDEKESQCKNQHLHHSWGRKGLLFWKEWRATLAARCHGWKQLLSSTGGGHFWQNIGGHRERDFGGQGQWLAKKNRPVEKENRNRSNWCVSCGGIHEFIWIHSSLVDLRRKKVAKRLCFSC